MSSQKQNDELAWMPSWVIKLLAGAFIMALVAWASYQTTTNYAQASDIAVIQSEQVNTKEQLNRIEAKLDKALNKP